MSRKNKGAALFELLHRDKGKATTADGSLKMPSWFRTKNQPSTPARPENPAKPNPQPDDDRQLDEVLDSQVPAEPVAVEQPKAEAAPPAEAAVGRPVAQPTVAVAVPRQAPTLPASSGGGTGAAASPGRLVPPWATGSWLQTANGRVRVNVTTFAACVVLGVAACVLIIVFSLGRLSVWQKSASPQPDAPHTEVNDAMSGKANPDIANPRNTGGSNAGGTGANLGGGGAGASGNAGTGAAGGTDGNAGPVQNLPPGNNYVIVMTGLNKDECDKVCLRLRQKGFDLVVASQQGRMHTVRTRVGTDVRAVKLLCQQLDEAKAQLFAEQPSLLRGYKPNDPNHRPYATTF